MSLIRKRKLTQNQNRQIQKNLDTKNDELLATGVVISHFGKQLDVQTTILPTQPLDERLTHGSIWRCHARTNLPMLCCGDVVKFATDPNDELGVIEYVAPRTTLVCRPDRYHKLKPVASNTHILAIVFAPLPKPASELIDRYLLIARLSGLTPLLILNKADILDEHVETDKIYNQYQALGQRYHFNTIKTSTQTDQGLDTLRTYIDGKLSIFAGQSGVGKSSLINKLLPHAEQPTNVISANSQLGQHTTTTSRLLPYNITDLTCGGIIDTPGIREFGIWHLSGDEILSGFDELNEISGLCQFRDCNHQPNARGCHFWEAVMNGKVDQRRLESFLRLIDESKSGGI